MANIICIKCHCHKPRYAKNMCGDCYRHDLKQRAGLQECANCGEKQHITARGLCSRCYSYQKDHGTPRPAGMRPRIDRVYFFEEWEHMRLILGAEAAKKRLSDAFGMNQTTIETYVSEYDRQEAAA